MTATQVFLLFLKKNCIREEYLFFRNTILYDNGNKFFKKRKLYKNTFVEDYLSRNNRALNNFMTRLFILAPNLINRMHRNPRYCIIRSDWCKKHGVINSNTEPRYIRKMNLLGCLEKKQVHFWKEWKASGMYLVYYRKLWNKFLKEYIDDSEKKINSPFKKGECYNFKLKK